MFELLTPLVFATPLGIALLFSIMGYWYKSKPESTLAKILLVIKAIIWSSTLLIGFGGGLASLSILVQDGSVPSIMWVPTVVSVVLFPIVQAIWPVFPNR